MGPDPPGPHSRMNAGRPPRGGGRSTPFSAASPANLYRKQRTMLRQPLLAARKNDAGFTLIELLIVIIILGLLAGIAVFGVDAFKNDGKDAACNANKKNLEVAAQAFYAKN